MSTEDAYRPNQGGILALAKAFATEAEDVNYRVAPANLDAERALLGAIFVNNHAYDRISDFLLPEHFTERMHQDIFGVTSQLIRQGRIATPVTVQTYIAKSELAPGISTSHYLARLAREAAPIINAADYGRTIYELAIRRNLILIGEEIVNVAYDPPVELAPSKQIEEAERKLYEVAEKGRYDSGFQAFSDAIKIAIDMASRAYERDGKLSGLATGLLDLDKQMGGLQPSDLIVIAGRPGMGKTALATSIGFNIAKSYHYESLPDGSRRTINGGIVGFFSLEMSAEQLATRVISDQSSIPSSRIRRGDIHENELQKLIDASRTMLQIPFHIDQTGGISIAQLASRARRLKRQKGLDVLFVDYLQLVIGSKSRGDNPVQEITEITTGLKALAKELNIPIVALSQLSRQVESREDKRPQLADLRGSGSIEQDADVVIFVYREEYYLKNGEPKVGSEAHITWMSDMERWHGKAEVIISKQRHGPTGTLEVAFDAEFTRFGNLAKHIPQITGT